MERLGILLRGRIRIQTPESGWLQSLYSYRLLICPPRQLIYFPQCHYCSCSVTILSFVYVAFLPTELEDSGQQSEPLNWFCSQTYMC